MTGKWCFKCKKTFVQYSKNVCMLVLDDEGKNCLPLLYCSKCTLLLTNEEKGHIFIDWFTFKWYLVKNNISVDVIDD
jgi:hypothetical protein